MVVPKKHKKVQQLKLIEEPEVKLTVVTQNPWDADFKELSRKFNKLYKLYHSNYKYIKDLYAKINQIKEEMKKYGG